jgi:hypothetical protein
MELDSSTYKDSRYSIFIPGNVPSSKNSKRIIQIYTGLSSCCSAKYFKLNGKYICSKCRNQTYPGKRPILAESELTKNYRESNIYLFEKYKDLFINRFRPIYLGMYFVRDSRRAFDYNNISQVICDMLTSSGCIKDDNSDELIPVFLGYEVDKMNPGVYLSFVKKPFYNLLTCSIDV